MSKVLAFQTLRGSIQAAQDGAGDYKNALYLLVSYAAQLKAYKWPDNPPEGWDEAQKTWASMTGTLKGWVYGTLETVTKIPKELLDSSSITIIPKLDTAIYDAGVLAKNPKDTSAKKDLLEITLPALTSKFNEFSTQTTALLYRLEDQATVFDGDAKTIHDNADKALKKAAEDADTIKELTQQIQALRADITVAALAIAGGSILLVTGVVMVGAAIALAGASEGMSLFLLVPAGITAGAGAYIIATNAERIKKDQREIDEKVNQVAKNNKDLVFLNTVASDLGGFASKVEEMKNALSVIAKPWQEAENYFTHAYNELIDVEAKPEDWLAFQNELLQIEKDWNNLMPIMEQLLLAANMVKDTKIEIGMDENQVKQALDKGKSVDIFKYIAA
jgi:CRISPR/Cas system CMR-associated protein Cmr5 small subunit